LIAIGEQILDLGRLQRAPFPLPACCRFLDDRQVP
jgi:hypothetical protein